MYGDYPHSSDPRSIGTAGFGGESWSMGRDLGASYAANPVLMPVVYDPYASAGSRFSSTGLSASTVPRMYHSSSTLLPDGMCLFGLSLIKLKLLCPRICVSTVGRRY